MSWEEKYTTIGEFGEVVMGMSPKGDTYNEDEKGLPLLNGPTEFGSSHPSPTLYTTDSKRESKVGDLLFCVRGSTTGRMNWSNEIYSLGRGVCAIRGETESDTKYLKYVLEVKLSSLLNVAGGGTFPNLKKGDLKGFEIPILEKKDKLVSIISTYDHLIENNLKRIKLLEQAAQNIYKEWFVHLRFPGHEEATFDEETGLPEGWEYSSFSDVSKNNNRKRIPLNGTERSKRQGNYRYYGATGVMDYIDDYIFEGRFLLVAEDGTVYDKKGNAYTQLVQGKFWVNNHAHIISGSKLPIEYIYLAMKHYPIGHLITGAVQPKLSMKNLKRVEVINPSRDVLNKFMSIINPMINQKFTLTKQNQKLKEARDILLPRLMNKTIEV